MLCTVCSKLRMCARLVYPKIEKQKHGKVELMGTSGVSIIQIGLPRWLQTNGPITIAIQQPVGPIELTV